MGRVLSNPEARAQAMSCDSKRKPTYRYGLAHVSARDRFCRNAPEDRIRYDQRNYLVKRWNWRKVGFVRFPATNIWKLSIPAQLSFQECPRVYFDICEAGGN